MKQSKKAKTGYAIIELPVALAVLGLLGLLVAWALGPNPWYGWVIAFFSPLALLLVGIFLMDAASSFFEARKSPPRTNKDS